MVLWATDGARPWNINPESKRKSSTPSSWEGGWGASSCSLKPFSSDTRGFCCLSEPSRSEDYGHASHHGRPSRTIRSISAFRDSPHTRPRGTHVTFCISSRSMFACRTCSNTFDVPMTWSVVHGRMQRGAGCSRSLSGPAVELSCAAASSCSAREGTPRPSCLQSTQTAACPWSIRASSTDGRRREEKEWSWLVAERRLSISA